MKFWVPLLFIIFTKSSFSQVTFQKRFGHPQSNVAEFVNDAALDISGNLYIVGNNSLNTFNLTKVDSLGSTSWMKTLSSINIEPNRIIYSNDSSIVIAGRGSISISDNFIFLLKADTSGTILWSRYISTGVTFNLIKFLIEDDSGNLILGGYQNIEFDTIQMDYKYIPIIVKFDLYGNLSWFKYVHGIYTSGFNDGFIMNNGNYLMTGFVGDTILGNKDILILETDSSGLLQRTMAIGNTSLDLGQKIVEDNQKITLAANDNNFSPTGTAHFIELDSSWNILQNRKNYTNGGVSTYDMIPYLNNTYLISANGPMLYIVDSTLKIISGMNYGNSGFNRRIHKSFNIGNGRVFCAGTNGDVADVLVLRTNFFLNAGCNSYTTILFNDNVPLLLTQNLNLFVTDTVLNIFSFDSLVSNGWDEMELCNNYTGYEDLQYELKSKIIVYPNPSTGIINLFVDLSLNEKKIHIEIIDLYGHSLLNCWRDYASNYSLPIDVSFLSNGCYILKISTHEKSSFEKFVINK